MRIRIRTVVWTAVVIVAFGIGVALGEALHDNPGSGDVRTLVRTLSPLPASCGRGDGVLPALSRPRATRHATVAASAANARRHRRRSSCYGAIHRATSAVST